MTKSAASFTQKGLFNYALIAAEIFPVMEDVLVDDKFFSDREREVLHHLLREKTVCEISHAVSLARGTVDHHIECIKLKMKLTETSSFVTRLMDQFSKAGWNIAS